MSLTSDDIERQEREKQFEQMKKLRKIAPDFWEHLFTSTVDARLLKLYREGADFTFPVDPDHAMTFIRAAYGLGYTDAFGDGGTLYELFGVDRPKPSGKPHE